MIILVHRGLTRANARFNQGRYEDLRSRQAAIFSSAHLKRPLEPVENIASFCPCLAYCLQPSDRTWEKKCRYRQIPASSLTIGNRPGANLWSDHQTPGLAWRCSAPANLCPSKLVSTKHNPVVRQPGRHWPGRSPASMCACIPGKPNEKPWQIQNLKPHVSRCYRGRRRGVAGAVV